MNRPLRTDLPDAHADIGRELLEKGEVDDAITEERLALVLKPDLAGAHYLLGTALERKADPASRGAALEEYREQLPS